MMGLYLSEATAACPLSLPPSLSLPPLQNMLDNLAGVSVGAFAGTDSAGLAAGLVQSAPWRSVFRRWLTLPRRGLPPKGKLCQCSGPG